MSKKNVVLENFLEMLSAERSVSLNTLSAYKNDISRLLLWLDVNKIDFLNVDLNNLEKYVFEISSKRSFSSKTVSRNISAIRQFFSFLMSERMVYTNVAVDLVMPKKSCDLPKALGKNEIEMLLEAAYKDESPEGVRTVMMLELLYATGMRISELVNLKIQAIHEQQDSGMHYIIVHGKGGKERVVLLNDDAVEALNKYLELRHFFVKEGAKTDLLFPSVSKIGKVKPLTRQRFGQILRMLAVYSGVNPALVSPHKIRHSFATHMLQNGANLRVVQELLGHSSITSTQIYTKISDDQAAKLVFEKHPLGQL